MTLPIVVCCNGSYDDLVTSIMDSGDLDCELSNVMISYLTKSRKKVHSMIISNDRCMSLYMLDIGVDVFRSIIRINVVERPFEEPLNLSPPPPWLVDDSVDYENKSDHPINIEDDSMDMEYNILDLEGIEEDCGSGSQPNHSFSDETNLYPEQIFNNNKELKMLLDRASIRQSFNFVMEKSCRKFLKVKCVSRGCAQRSMNAQTYFSYTSMLGSTLAVLNMPQEGIRKSHTRLLLY